MQTQIKLTVEFINKVMVGRKVVRATLSGKRWGYYGKTKKECLAKATKCFKNNALYKHTYEVVELIED